MTTTASRSSTIASAVTKMRSPSGARLPSRARTPRAKAMSVAIGTPQPRAAVPPPASARKIKAGSTAPPIAAAMGRVARRSVASSPTRISRLISRPTTRKNTAIRPSLTQWRSDSDRCRPPRSMASSVPHRSAYADANGEFAHNSATAAAAMRSTPLEALARENSRNGASRRSTGGAALDVTGRPYPIARTAARCLLR